MSLSMRELRVRTGPDGVVSLSGKLNPEGGARVLEVINSLNDRRSAVDGVADQRSPARRNADALVEAMSCLLDEGLLPTPGGQRPHLVLTMELNDLIDGLGSAVLDTGGRLAAAEARRLACDSCVVPMELGGDSMPLDVGRQQHLSTAGLRNALAQRDKGFHGRRGRRAGLGADATRREGLRSAGPRRPGEAGGLPLRDGASRNRRARARVRTALRARSGRER
jgi:hypothetical protein